MQMNPRPFPFFMILCLLLVGMALPPASGAGRQYTLTGQTMGTFYSIKFISMKKQSASLWQQRVETRLQEVNDRLSMYNPKSEISLFNRLPAHQSFRLSPDFYQVLVQCQYLYQITQGAWDGTVKPLVDLWGFGTLDRPDSLPDPGQIQAALDRTGFFKLELTDHRLTKKHSNITLDLGSIAKGYGVDAIAELLAAHQIQNFLVEIGGELVGSGTNKKGDPWTVGITRPDKNGYHQGVYKVIALENMAIATSGNYRNFFEREGQTFSHIINPKTGFPVENQVVSASVIAENCTLADGLATALMVLDLPKGMALIQSLAHTECLIIQKQGDRFIATRSPGFGAFEQE